MSSFEKSGMDGVQPMNFALWCKFSWGLLNYSFITTFSYTNIDN